MSSTRPRPEHYRTAAEYRWARRLWKRSRGGSLLALLAIAAFFGALSGSQAAMFALIAFAVICFVIARSRP
jgi:TRAP-type C4-dicarboxylate transport system permease large subunit